MKVKWAECKYDGKVVLYVRTIETKEGIEDAAKTAAASREKKLSDDPTLDWKSISVRVFSDEEHEFYEENWNNPSNWENYLSEGGKEPKYIGPKYNGQ